MDVKCINNQPCDSEGKLHPDLTSGNIYMVIGIEGEYYRISGDLGLPYLYHSSRFEIVDAEREKSWIHKIDEDIGEIWYPDWLIENGIFEEFFADNLEAILSVRHSLKNMSNRRTGKLYDKKYDELLPE